MRFTTGNLTRCSGGSHIDLPVTVGGQSASMSLSSADIAVDFSSRDEAAIAITARLRSAVKEWAVANGKTVGQMTLANFRSALEGKDFSL